MNKNKSPNTSNNQILRNMNIQRNIPNATSNIKNNQQQGLSSAVKGYSGSTVFGIILLVVVIIIILYACYWAYLLYSSKTFATSIDVVALADVKDATSKVSIGSGTIPSSKYSNEYSISMWLNITDYSYNYGTEKTILRRGAAGSGNFEIVLADKSNDLIVRLKLQGPSPVSSFTVSKFEDIPNALPNALPNVLPQTHKYNINEPEDTGYIHSAFNVHGTSTKFVPCKVDNMVYNKISGNNIDYPTIKYDISSGCNNILNTMKPADAMTIMLEQSTRMKEGFKCASNKVYKGDQQSLGHVDTSKLSDNSAPFESQVIHNDYFSLVSGNEVVSCPKLKIENFDNTSDLVNSISAVLIDLCNLATALQNQTNADDQVNSMNLTFQHILNALEQSRTTAKMSQDVDKAFSGIIAAIPNLLNSNSNISQNITQLQTDIKKLTTLTASTSNTSVTSVTSINNTDLLSLYSAINSKLAASSCSITLSGTNNIDLNVNLYENIINLIKEAFYTYINNMGYGIQKAYPNLASTTNVSCLIDAASNKDPTIGTCIYKMLPLQKWVSVIVSVYNQVIDIYIDGQLASSCVLKGFPAISTDDINLTPDGGFSGQMSQVIFSNTAMTVHKARELYYAGPVPSVGLFSMIPSWFWYSIILIIIIVIIYLIFK